MKVTISIAYDPNLSKNKKYISRNNKILNPKYKRVLNEIYYKLASHNPVFKKDKIKIDILWMRSNMLGDISNFVDGVFDAIKLYTKRFKIDDNWFTGSFDFIHQKGSNASTIFITISQSDLLR